MSVDNSAMISKEVQARLENLKNEDVVVYPDPQDYYFTPTSNFSEVRMIDEYDYVLGSTNGDGSGAINHSLQSLVNRDKYLDDKIDTITNTVNSYTDTEIVKVNDRINSEVIALNNKIAILEQKIAELTAK